MFSFFEFLNNCTNFLNFNFSFTVEEFANYKNTSFINIYSCKELIKFFYSVNWNFSFNSMSISFLYIYILLLFVYFVISFISFYNVKFNLFPLLNQYILFFSNSVEKEIFNFNSKLMFGAILLLFIISNSLGFFNYKIFPLLSVLNFQFLMSLVIVVLIIPVNLIFSFSGYFLSYIRGASLKKNLFFETLIDCLNLTSFFLRINIQFIRIMLINFMFFTYEDSYYHAIYPFYNINNLNYNCQSIYDYLDFYLSYFCIYILQILYEIAHLWVIFIMQSTVFALIITFLIQFLYNSFLIKTMILFYKHKRKNKN